MFEVGWSEILVIAIVALIVFPTKDLPRLLRTVGQLVGKARRMAGDMQAQFNQALREAEREADLADLKSSVQNANPLTDLKKTLYPVRTLGDDLKKSMTSPIAPKEVEVAETPVIAAAPAVSATSVEQAVPVDAHSVQTPAPVAGQASTETKAPEVSGSAGKDGGTP